MMIRELAIGAAFRLALGTGAAVRADCPTPASPDRIALSVLIAHGSQEEGDAGGGVDAECEPLKRRLPVAFNTLRARAQRCFNLAFGERAEMTLPSGGTVQFLPISIVDDRLHVQVEMPGVLNTRLRTLTGRAVIVAAGKDELGQLFIQLTPSFTPPVLVDPSQQNVPKVRQVGDHPQP
jgi:hypothetical protein